MNTFTESQWPGVLLGILLAAMLAAGWLKTGRGTLLAGAAVALLVGILLAMLSWWVETPREQVRATVLRLAEALEDEQDRVILDMIHSAAPDIRDRAAAELKRYSFRRVAVKNNLRIEVADDRAQAKFNVVVEIDEFPRSIPRYVELTFYRETDGQWRVADYYHADPRRGFLKGDD